MPAHNHTPRANKKHAHRVASESTHGVHTLCGCIIPWITETNHPAASYTPAVIASKPVCPECDDLKALNTDMDAIECTSLLDEVDRILSMA